MDHLDAIRNRVTMCPVDNPPSPWNLLSCHAIGGLTDVGFLRDSDFLLVVSSQGRGVFDCISGERVARDRDENAASDAYSSMSLESVGIGPLDGKIIRLAGLNGGGLPNRTDDGWSVDAISLEWPYQHLLIFSEWTQVYDLEKPITKLAVESEVRAYGFSPTGRSLIVATPSDVSIYGRPAQ